MNCLLILPEEIIVNEIIGKLDNSHKYILSLVSKYFKKKLFGHKKFNINIKELMPTINIKLLEFLLDIGLKEKFFTNLCESSAEHGNLAVLKWAHKNGCEWDSDTCWAAARHGHLEILKWAHQNGCEWDSCTCHVAAYNGHLEILKWARSHGCAWDYSTCLAAAAGGHLNVLKWARQNGCEWEASTCSEAAYNSHLGVLKWACENGCPHDHNKLCLNKN